MNTTFVRQAINGALILCPLLMPPLHLSDLSTISSSPFSFSSNSFFLHCLLSSHFDLIPRISVCYLHWSSLFSSPPHCCFISFLFLLNRLHTRSFKVNHSTAPRWLISCQTKQQHMTLISHPLNVYKLIRVFNVVDHTKKFSFTHVLASVESFNIGYLPVTRQNQYFYCIFSLPHCYMSWTI